MMLVNCFTVTLITLIIKIVCLLVAIAYYTLAERKIMASVQRRLGPNVVGFWGMLQPLSDALKLVGKELVIPSHANSRIFIFAPMGVLWCALLAWGVIPFHLFDHSTNMDLAELTRTLLNTTQGVTNDALPLVCTLLPVAAANDSPTGPALGKLLDGQGNFYVLRGEYVKCDLTLTEEQSGVLVEFRAQFGGTVARRTGRAGKKLTLSQKTNK